MNTIVILLFIPAVKEGIALSDGGLSPYSGDVFHEVLIELTII